MTTNNIYAEACNAIIDNTGTFTAGQIRDQAVFIQEGVTDLLAALVALDAHYRKKIVVHDGVLKPNHPLKLACAAIAKAKGK